MRHNRPTLWSVWGIPQAINTGDALYALAFKALLSLRPDNTNSSQILRAAQVYTDAVLRITEGQYRDINFETKNNVSEQDYLEMIQGKTAALFALSCELGAIVACAENVQQQRIRDFGHMLGMAFQMQDDILGLWGDPVRIGKPVGADLLKGKKTLPIIHCAQKSTEFYQLMTRTMNATQLKEGMRALDLAGSFQYTIDKANDYANQALDYLNDALPGHSQTNIRQLVDNLLNRQM
jgi:geranylgeranyl diphosphate synthase type I